jgi:hypothetical protein
VNNAYYALYNSGKIGCQVGSSLTPICWEYKLNATTLKRTIDKKAGQQEDRTSTEQYTAWTILDKSLLKHLQVVTDSIGKDHNRNDLLVAEGVHIVLVISFRPKANSVTA